ncbi:MAG: Rha family transcriptional regulator [Fusobacteriaceae bacterium]|nr:Rha family transcriptional regulator [Fusobacteriaceae bacterium]MBN2837450.1 Rha family transcriptional regulator [Fusobacteriaceae bacterium]
MDLVRIENGQAFTDSLKVSAVFGKQHYHVVRDIEILISNMKVLSNEEQVLNVSEGMLKIEHTSVGGISNFGYTQTNVETSKFFIESSYTNLQNKKQYKMYKITRDGLSLLVMGFTGQKALEWKLKYIEAFNYMEESLMKVGELSIADSREWELLKGSARSIIMLKDKIQNDMKEIEKIIRRVDDHRQHLGIYGTQILDMMNKVEDGKLRDKNEY